PENRGWKPRNCMWDRSTARFRSCRTSIGWYCVTDMRSPRALAAAVVFLLALPFTLLYQVVVGGGVEVVIHAALALGSGLMSFAVFDFRTARWMAWVGSASSGAL